MSGTIRCATRSESAVGESVRELSASVRIGACCEPALLSTSGGSRSVGM